MDMPMKKKRTIAAQAAARGPLPELLQELLDEVAESPIGSDVSGRVLRCSTGQDPQRRRGQH